jgi:hypothetical protein
MPDSAGPSQCDGARNPSRAAYVGQHVGDSRSGRAAAIQVTVVTVAVGLALLALLVVGRDSPDGDDVARPGGTMRVDSYAVDRTDGSLEVGYADGSCSTASEVVVVAGPDVVDVAVRRTHLPNRAGDACPAVIRFVRADVPLDEPLGTRRVTSLGHVVPRTSPR